MLPIAGRRFLRNAAWLAAAEVLVRAKSLLVIPILTRHFGEIGYGAWAQVSVLVALVTPVITLATDSAAMRFMPGADEAGQRRMLVSWVTGLVALSVIVGGALALLRAFVAPIAFGNSAYTTLVAVACLALLTSVLFSSASTWLRVRERARVLAAVTVVGAIWSVAAASLVAVFNLGPVALVLLMLSADAALAIVVLAPAVLSPPLVHPTLSTLLRFAKYSIPLLPAAFSIFGLNLMDRLFLVHYRDLAVVGVYSLSYSIGYIIVQTVVSPISVMFPPTAAALWESGNRNEIQELFDRSFRMICFVMVPAIVGSAVLGAPLLHLLAPAGFASAAPVIPIVMAGYLFSIISHYYEVLLGLTYRQRISGIATIIAFLVNLALNFVLIPRFGAIGAGVATGLAFLLQLSITLAMATRSRLLQTDAYYVARTLLATAAMAAIIVPANWLLNTGASVRIVVIAMLGATVYCFCGYALKILHPRATITSLRSLRAPIAGDPQDG